ncbi:MAG TPA: HIT domain-containing protein, partial [Gammaproteobacteria bacterium]|nr:HIT domain-containing protein [Gammaproteobacteria bacterium]
IFCKIIDRNVPAAIICEEEHAIAFMDAFPSSEGHALVVPKAHHPNLLTLSSEALQAAAALAQRVAQAQMQALEPDGIVLTQFNGAAVGQTVFHYHVHVVPRRQGQDPAIHGRTPGDPAALQALAAKLAAALP